MKEPKGKLKNCMLIPKSRKKNDWMFMQRADGTIVANLDGYMIRPLTKEELRARREMWKIEKPS